MVYSVCRGRGAWLKGLEGEWRIGQGLMVYGVCRGKRARLKGLEGEWGEGARLNILQFV